MSPHGRPTREYRSAEHEATPMSLHGRQGREGAPFVTLGEYGSAQHEASLMSHRRAARRPASAPSGDRREAPWGST